MTLQEQLQDLDLTESEINLYLTLLQQGQLQAGKISKKTKLNRTTVYQVLEKLIGKGLVSYVKAGKVKVFQAVSPQRLVSLQKEKVALAEGLVSQLETLHVAIEHSVTLYKGRKGIRSIMSQILHCKEYISFGSAGHFLSVMKHDFLLYQKEKRKRRIRSRVLLGRSSMKKQIVTSAYADFRFIPDKYMTPTTIWVYANSVAIITWIPEPIATVITNPDLRDAYRSYFELLWKGAKKMERVC